MYVQYRTVQLIIVQCNYVMTRIKLIIGWKSVETFRTRTMYCVYDVRLSLCILSTVCLKLLNNIMLLLYMSPERCLRHKWILSDNWFKRYSKNFIFPRSRVFPECDFLGLCVGRSEYCSDRFHQFSACYQICPGKGHFLSNCTGL